MVLNLRLQEQASIFNREPPLERIRIFVDEVALLRVGRSRREYQLLAEQLIHVLHLIKQHSNIEFRIVPFDSEHAVAAGMWPQLLLAYGHGPEFPEGRIVFRERHFNDAFFDGTEDGGMKQLKLAEWALDVIEQQALNSEATVARIFARLQELVAQ